MTGEANYFEEKRDKSRVVDIVRASSSLPFVCPVTYVDGVPMLDGGIVDSIPLQRAIADGYTRNVVILTVIVVTGKTRKISVFHRLCTGNIRSCVKH